MKWTASVVMLLCSWLSYVDRQILAVLAPVILADTGLSTQSYGTVVSAFSIAYMLANPLWGSVLDFVGLRAGMLIAVSVWSLASASHAWMTGFLGFAVARTILGLGEGATFPGGLRAALESLPAGQQSRGIAIAYSGGSLGAILTPLMVTPLATRFGWQAAFLLSGALGALWLVLWWAIARPPYLPALTRRPAKIQWPNFFESRLWALVFSYGLGALPIGPMLYLSPLYLNRVLGLSQQELGRVLWIPPLGWEIGYFFWGWAADRFQHVHPMWFFTLLTVCGLPLGLVPQIHSVPIVLAIFFWTMFVSGGYLVLSLRVASRTYPQAQSGLVAGIGAGAWSAIVALFLPVLGAWFDQRMYGVTFWVVALTPVLGTLLWRVTGPPRAATS